MTHLLNAGYQCTIYNRTPSKCLPVQAKGAVVASSPHAVAAASDVVFVIVGFPSDVRNVVLGTEGILKGLKAGGVLVDCTTSTPSLAQEIYTTGQAQGVSTVDAPVSGGDVGARNAALSFMVGGDKQVVDSLHPLWTLMGQNMRYMGGPGKGQHTKMVNQILIANTMMGEERMGELALHLWPCLGGGWGVLARRLLEVLPATYHLPFSSLHLTTRHLACHRCLRRAHVRREGGPGPD